MSHDPSAGLTHDLNNVLQTLVGVALQSEDEGTSAAILRCVERARSILGSAPDALLPLETLVQNAATFARDHSGAAVMVTCDVDPGIQLPPAWERVLVNLFLNAVRAMGENGAIRVTGRRGAEETRIAVRDDGPGIAEPLLERLFEPHVSGNGSTGLGLSIVRGIVEASGGVVRACNGEGGGAEFTMVLPHRQARSLTAGAR